MPLVRLPEGLAVARRWWLPVVGACVAFRIALPLAALAAGERGVPGQPAYDYGPYRGDATGFYAGTRELVSAVARQAPLVIAVAAVTAAAAVAALLLHRRARIPGWVALSAPVLTAGAGLALVVRGMVPTGTGTLGWPLVWSIPVFPLRVLGAANPDTAYAAGLVLSLLAIGAIVVATAYLGLFATGSPAVGATAAALFAAWPFVSRAVAGPTAWENGTWETDVGLHLYSEPLSTATVTVVLALALAPRAPSPMRSWTIGLLAGLAVLVRLSNFLVALAVALFLLWRSGVRSAVAAALAGLASLPAIVAFWQVGYTPFLLEEGQFPVYAFALDHVGESWGESLLWHPTTLLVLAPLALVGLAAVRRPAALLLGASVASTAVFYSLYYMTAQHPRFLFAVLPALLVLEAAGAVALVRRPRSGAGSRGRSSTVAAG